MIQKLVINLDTKVTSYLLNQKVSVKPTPYIISQILEGISVSEDEVFRCFEDTDLPFIHLDFVVVVIPPGIYADSKKKVKIENVLKSVFNEAKIDVISKIDAIASILVKERTNRKLRISNFELFECSIFDIEIKDGKLIYCDNYKINMIESRLEQRLNELSRDRIWQDSKVFLFATETLNSIYNDEYSKIEDRYYCYRVDYDSNITYKDLHDFFSEWAEGYSKKITKDTFSNDSFEHINCGSLTSIQFFNHFFHTSERTLSEEEILQGAFYWDIDNFEREFNVDVSVVLNRSFEYSLVRPTMHSSSGQLSREKNLVIRYYLNKSNSILLKINDTLVRLDLNKEIDTALVTSYFTIASGSLEWIRLSLDYTLDRWNNISLNFYYNNNFFFSEIIDRSFYGTGANN